MIINRRKYKKIKTNDMRPAKIEVVAKVIDAMAYRMGWLIKFEIVSTVLKGTQFTKEFQGWGGVLPSLLKACGAGKYTDLDLDDEVWVDKIKGKLFSMELSPKNFKFLDNFETFKRMTKTHVRLAKKAVKRKAGTN